MAFPGITKHQGRDFNFYKIISVNWSQFGSLDGYIATDGYGPDVIITFPTQGVSFISYGSTSGSHAVEYSFNGTTVHGDLTPGTPSAGLIFDSRTISLIWFRLKSGSSGPVDIRIEAWAKD